MAAAGKESGCSQGSAGKQKERWWRSIGRCQENLGLRRVHDNEALWLLIGRMRHLKKNGASCLFPSHDRLSPSRKEN